MHNTACLQTEIKIYLWWCFGKKEFFISSLCTSWCISWPCSTRPTRSKILQISSLPPKYKKITETPWNKEYSEYKSPKNLLLVQITVCNRILFFILAGALLFVEKSAKGLHYRYWFRLRDVGIFQIFYSRALIQRTIVDFPAFLEPGLAKKIPVCAHTYRDPNKQEAGFIFVWSSSEPWSLFKNS